MDNGKTTINRSNSLTRCIMIFPDFDNLPDIQFIREQYDPLYRCVAPHVTLVFPFTSDLTGTAVANHLQNAVQEIAPFKLVMQGIKPNTICGKYLFLEVIEGTKELNQLHNRLYSGLLSAYEPEFLKQYAFHPHMTVGKFGNDIEFQSAIKATESFTTRFETTVKKISVEIIGECDNSTIETEVCLR